VSDSGKLFMELLKFAFPHRNIWSAFIIDLVNVGYLLKKINYFNIKIYQWFGLWTFLIEQTITIVKFCLRWFK
jgi:hypothetical protein